MGSLRTGLRRTAVGGEMGRMKSVAWTDWEILMPAGAFSPAVLAETLDGGQAFRWNRAAGELTTWTGVWSDCVAQLQLGPDGRLSWSAPVALAARVASALPAYLGLDRDWAALTDTLPWRSDAHLAQCIGAFPRLRLLRQPFGETLLGFLCSATKQIVQIKQMLALLASRHGAPLVDGSADRQDGAGRLSARTGGDPDRQFHRLPTWREIARVPERELRACLLGFRARYISETAHLLDAHPGWLEATEALPYAEAKARLCTLPGVGEKVADCVLLFGAGRLEAFPVDVWVLRSLADRYGLRGWKPAQVAHFGRTHFGPLAGLAQQYLFAFERRAGGR